MIEMQCARCHSKWQREKNDKFSDFKTALLFHGSNVTLAEHIAEWYICPDCWQAWRDAKCSAKDTSPARTRGAVLKCDHCGERIDTGGASCHVFQYSGERFPLGGPAQLSRKQRRARHYALGYKADGDAYMVSEMTDICGRCLRAWQHFVDGGTGKATDLPPLPGEGPVKTRLRASIVGELLQDMGILAPRYE